ncbi:FUSC family protein [Fictibacillus sp. KIGAM418]|uniref:FUSC family protein n=1 Tax=Fictibacillus marinisediminis TaxID=2878389 RepID=A0A9X1X7Z5_9BACL|nr:FUSC family protein [Fictibacillus marinisediminis]MCK6255634.1 FUSC family protein [Fictibacillus marinisediminis]
MRYWMYRLLASDPGRKRLRTASKVTLSVISSVVVMLIIVLNAGGQITAAIFAGVVGMMGILVVNDDTEKEQKLTTVLLAASSACSLATGSWLSKWGIAADLFLLLVVFLALYLQRFGSRYFSICMIAFMSFYFATLLKVTFAQVPWLFASIATGILFAYFYNFILIKDKPEEVLKRSMGSFHIQANLTLNIVIDIVRDIKLDKQRLANLDRNVKKLGDYARVVSNELGSTDPGGIWPGLSTSQLRLYIFDTAMLMETLSPSIRRLKEHRALENHSIRSSLLLVIQSIREAEVLNREQVHYLENAAASLQSLRQLLRTLKLDKRNEEWLYLIRRIESIANHIIDGAFGLQQSLQRTSSDGATSDPLEKEDTEEDAKNEEEEGMRPTTKKAIQALIAGGLSIVLGHIYSPAHQYWILLSCFVVLLGTETVGRTLVKAVQRSVGTFLGAIAGFIIALYLTGIQDIILLFICVFLAFYLLPISYTLMMFWITMLLALMYDILLGGINEQLMAARVIDTVAGVGLGFAVSALVYPQRTRDKVTTSTVEYLNSLKEYVDNYIDRFREKHSAFNLADHALELDQLLQTLIDDASPLYRGWFGQSGIQQQLTVLTAINFYAKHLVASSTRKSQLNTDEKFEELINHVQLSLTDNIEALSAVIRGEGQAQIVNLEEERRQLERLPEESESSEHEMLNHLRLLHNVHYIWRINESIVYLARQLGAEPKSKG